MKKRGLAIHCHHGTLYEYCYDYDKRVRYIQSDKPKHEIETRLRLFKLLPDEAMNDIANKYLTDRANWCQDNAKQYQDVFKWHQANIAKWHHYAKQRYQDIAKQYQDKAKWYQDILNNKKTKGLSPKAFHKKWCGCKEWNGKEIVFKKASS